jgi:hypothetical protein
MFVAALLAAGIFFTTIPRHAWAADLATRFRPISRRCRICRLGQKWQIDRAQAFNFA